jgi:hypothetical protein
MPQPLLPSAAIAVAAVLVAPVAAAEEVAAPRPRVPFSVMAGIDTPLGLGGLSVGIETADGWALALAGGLSDARPGAVHYHLAVQGRVPVWQSGAFDLSGLVFVSRADRDVQRESPGRRWEWRPGYRFDAGVSARYRWGMPALRLDAGVGYLVNDPRCRFSSDLGWVDCTDPVVPAEVRRQRPAGTFAPWIALAAELDMMPPPGPPPAEAEAAAAGAARGRWDARESNGLVAPTALTLPAGSVRVTLYELVVPEVAVGITDRLQVSGGGIWIPPAGGLELILTAQVKYQVIDRGPLRLAPLATILAFTGEYGRSAAIMGAGAAASLCLDGDCDSLISAAIIGGAQYFDSYEGQPEWRPGIAVSPSFIFAVHRNVKLVAEVHAVSGEWAVLPIVMARFAFRRFGAEVGAMVNDGYPFPVGSLSWRFR